MFQSDERRSGPDADDVTMTEPVRTVAVPAYAGTLAQAARDRVRRLRRHLIEAMRAERELKPRDGPAPREVREPAGFAAVVTDAACALCRGWCCGKGGEHAYLDGPSMARVRRARPDLDARAILRLYAKAAADPAYVNSCVFHGAQGCTLDRSLRSDLCNRYFCSGLAAFLRENAGADSVTLVAGSGTSTRRSWVNIQGDRSRFAPVKGSSRYQPSE